MSQATFALQGHNPDVLTCIANLSNDEVFTPPEFANQMLDTLEQSWAMNNNGENIWANKEVTFLDPCTKSGVFLREIVKRLNEGLSQDLPDLTERINHILTKQVFGIGITELTSLLARRSVYCSKYANGIHSIARTFTNDNGNIWFERTEHTWVNGKCKFCSASKSEYARSKDLETHAYAFIHTDNTKNQISNIFGADMHFDVIIGNPPYQLSDGGGEGASAMPLYHRFVDQAKELDPKYLVMVIPARWYSGGKGLDTFRQQMLTDNCLAEIHDFPETDMVFPGVNIRGGICYFLRSDSHSGPTKVLNYRKSGDPLIAFRPLLEPGLSSFVRYNEAISILTKVRKNGEETFDLRVQSRNPYGIPSDFLAYSKTKSATKPVLLFRSRRGATTEKEVFIAENQITNNRAFKDKVKVLVSKASPGGDEYPHSVLGRPFVGPKNSVSTETYLIVDFVKSQKEGEHLVSYMETRFFRFLVSLIKNTQNISKGSFAFVPVQDLSSPWTDAMLYKKYGITKDEIAFIESMIRPVGLDNE
jgi:site-specific DNA-methyltransferase (adenine-specific)